MLLLRGTRHISGAQWPHMAGGCCIRRHRRPSQHHRKPAGQRGSLDSLDSVPSFRCSGRDFHRPLEGIWTLSTKPSAPAPPSAGSHHHHPAHCRAGCRPSRETACAPRVLSTPSAGAPCSDLRGPVEFTRQACFLASCWYSWGSAFFWNSQEEFATSSSFQIQLGIQRLEASDRRWTELKNTRQSCPFISVGYLLARQ